MMGTDSLQLVAQRAPVTARDILKALSEHYAPKIADRSVLFFEEFRVGTGYASDAAQRFDAYSLHCWPSADFARTVYEVKVSRGDLLKELKEPRKRRRALLWSNYYYFATPSNLVKLDELPVEAGLIELTGDGKLFFKVQAPQRDTPPPTWRLLVAIARRAYEDGRAEGDRRSVALLKKLTATESDPAMLALDEVARLLGMSDEQVRQEIWQGRLVAYSRSGNGKQMVRQSDLAAYAQARERA